MMAEKSLLELDDLHNSILSLCDDVCTEENQTSNPSVDNKPCEDERRNVEHLLMNSPSVGKERFKYKIRLSPIRKVKREDDATFEDSSFEFHCTRTKTDLKFDLGIDSTPKVKPSLMGLLLKARTTSTPLNNKWNTLKSAQDHGKSPGDRYIRNKVPGSSSSTARKELDVIPETKDDSKADKGTIECKTSEKQQTENDDDEYKLDSKLYNKTDDCDQTYDELLEDLSILCQTELGHDKLTDDEETSFVEPLSQIKSEHHVSQINIHSILKETKTREELERNACKNVLTTTEELCEGEECKEPGRFCGVDTTSYSRTSLCKIDDSFEECNDILGLDNFLISSDDEDKLDLTESSDETLLNQETVLIQTEDIEIQSKHEDIQSENRDMRSEDKGIHSDVRDFLSEDRDIYISEEKDIRSEVRELRSEDGDIQSKDRDMYSEDIQSDERDIQSKDRDIHSEDTDVQSEMRDTEISDTLIRNSNENSSEETLDKTCVLGHEKKLSYQDGMKQEEERDDCVNSESDTSVSEEFELDLTQYSDEIDDFLVEEGLRSDSWRNTDKKENTIPAQEKDKRTMEMAQDGTLMSKDSLKKRDRYEDMNPQKGVSQVDALKRGEKNPADSLQKEGLCSSLNKWVGNEDVGAKKVGMTLVPLSKCDENSDICAKKEEFSLRSSQESDEIDSFLQSEGFEVIDDWKYDSGSVKSSPVSMNSFNNVVGWKNTNIPIKNLSSQSSVASSLDAKTFTGPQLSPLCRTVDKDSFGMTRPSPVNIKSKPSTDYSKGSTKSGTEWSETDTEVIKSDTKERVNATTGKNKKRRSKNNRQRKASMKNDEHSAEYGKQICEVFPVKADLSGKFEISESDSTNNLRECLWSPRKTTGYDGSTALHRLPSDAKVFLPSPKMNKLKRPFHSSEYQWQSSESGCGAQSKKRRAPLLPTPSSSEKSQNFTSAGKPPIRRWSSSPPRNNFCENVQKKRLSQPIQRSVKVEPFDNEAERNSDAWNSQSNELNHCDSSVYWTPLDERPSHSENVKIEMMSNDARRKNVILGTYEQEMQSRGHRRPNFPPPINQGGAEHKEQLKNSNKENKQKHAMFIDYRAERQFIQNENDLTREVMNKWNTQGIQSPNINLTYAARLRQEGRGQQGRLEGKRNSTMYIPDDGGIDTMNNNNGHERLDGRHQKWDSKSMLNDINNLRRQLNDVSKARKAAVDSVVDEYSMEKNRLTLVQGNRTRELCIRQDVEMRRFQNQPFINPFFVQCQLLQLRCEHAQQKEHLHLFMCKEQKDLEESYELKVHGLVKRFDEKRQQLDSLINQLEQQKITNDASSPHVMTTFKSRYDCSKITVCLPIDIATSLVREDEVYDSYYSH